MKTRLISALVLVGGLLLGISGAEAGTPVMDGKKVKVLKLHADSGTQVHDVDSVVHILDDTDYTQCAPGTCAKLKFVYKPAKGAKGGLMMTATWGKQAGTDLDLYFYELDKRGNGTELASCGGGTGNTEKVFADRSLLRSGHTYMAVVYFYRSIADAVDLKVEMGVPSTIGTTYPAAVDENVEPLNCTS